MADPFDLRNRTALITGAGRRLGAAMATRLARSGAHVVLHHHRSGTEAAALRSTLEGHGVHAWTVAADLSVAGAGAALFHDAVRLAGPIDVLINNASVFEESRLLDVTEAEIAASVRLHAMAPLDLGRALHAQRRRGAIVNLLDTRTNDYDERHVAYHLGKRALAALTRMMAVEFAPNVRVNAISPGLVLPPEGKDATYLAGLASTNPLDTYGEPDDVAAAMHHLVTSPFVTGQTLYVDGGRHLRGDFYG